MSEKLTREDFGDLSWEQYAACLKHDPELFFPVGNTGTSILQIQEAKLVCKGCDVREACLEHALNIGTDHGVWGGLSEEERRALKRRNARASGSVAVRHSRAV